MDSQPDSIQNLQQEAQGDSSTPVADLNHDRIPLDTSSQTDFNTTTSQSLDNLRRSRRVPKPRSSIYDEYEEELKERANKPKRKRPAASKKKPSTTQKDKPSSKVEKRRLPRLIRMVNPLQRLMTKK